MGDVRKKQGRSQSFKSGGGPNGNERAIHNNLKYNFRY